MSETQQQIDPESLQFKQSSQKPNKIHTSNNNIEQQQQQQQLKYSTWFDEDEKPYTFIDRITSKDFISNLITFLIMIIGIILRITINKSDKNNQECDNNDEESRNSVGGYLLAFGVFGFAGGITNWLAVKMLFDDVPLIYGSGVIPNRFKEIRVAIKKMIMRSFFDEEYLKKFLAKKIQEFLDNMDVKQKMKDFMNSEQFDEILKQQINKLMASPQGMMLSMLSGGSSDGLLTMIKPMTGVMADFAAPILTGALQSEDLINIPKIRKQIDEMLEEKLLELTPNIVKKMMEDVMRKHLGWLVVWGNVFGSLIGLIAHICTVYLGIP